MRDNASLAALAAALLAGLAPAQPPAAGEAAFRAALATFTGRMVDGAGRPVANADVAVRVEDLDELGIGRGARWFAGSDHTDAEGRFEIGGLWPQRHYAVTAHTAELICWKKNSDLAGVLGGAWLPAPGERFDLGELRMVRAAAVHGKLLWPDGSPCAGGVVAFERDEELPHPDGPVGADLTERLQPLRVPGGPWVRSWPGRFEVGAWPTPEAPWRPCASASAGANGGFEVTGLLPGRWCVSAYVPGRHLPVSHRVDLEPGAHRDLGDVRLAAARTMVVRVVDERGAPVPSAEVLVVCPHAFRGFEQAGARAHADAAGRVALGGYPAAHVTIAARRNALDRWHLVERADASTAQTVRLGPIHAMSGRVVGPDGRGTAATLRLSGSWYEDEGAPVMRPVAAGGAFRIEGLAPGEYSVQAWTAERASFPLKLELTADAEIELTLSERRFPVRCVDEEDTPVAGAFVEGEWTDASGRAWLVPPWDPARMHSQLTVRASHPRFRPASVEVETWDPVEIALSRAHLLRGRLDPRPARASLAEWSVAVEPAEGNSAFVSEHGVSASVGEDGRFEVDLTAAVTHRVTVLCGDPLPLSIDAGTEPLPAVAAGEVATAVLPVTWSRAEPPARLRGVVRENGEAQAGVLLTTDYDRRVMTDAQGRFDFGAVATSDGRAYLGLGSGLVQLDRNWLVQTLWGRSLRVQPGEDRQVAIDLAAGSLAGRVTDAEHRPLFGAHVEVASLATPPEDQSAPYVDTVTDADGRFAVPVLPAGDYRLRATWGELAGGAPALTVAAERAVARDLELLPTVDVTGSLDVSQLGLLRSDVALRLEGLDDTPPVTPDDTGTLAFSAIPQNVYGVWLEVGGLRLEHRDPLPVEASGPHRFAIVFDGSYLVDLDRLARAAGYRDLDAWRATLPSKGAK